MSWVRVHATNRPIGCAFIGGQRRRGAVGLCAARSAFGFVRWLLPLPRFVATDINTSERNRPESAASDALDERSVEDEMRRKFLDEVVAPAHVARSSCRCRARRRVQRPVLIFTDLNTVAVLVDAHEIIPQNWNLARPRPC